MCLVQDTNTKVPTSISFCVYYNELYYHVFVWCWEGVSECIHVQYTYQREVAAGSLFPLADVSSSHQPSLLSATFPALLDRTHFSLHCFHFPDMGCTEFMNIAIHCCIGKDFIIRRLNYVKSEAFNLLYCACFGKANMLEWIMPQSTSL